MNSETNSTTNSENERSTATPAASKDIVSSYSKNEERANAISHGIGIIFGIIALYLMITKSQGDTKLLSSSLIYGISIILLFSTSTIYHSVTKASTRALMKTLDHCAIYLLIAGTYTPYMIISLTNHGGHFYLAAIWIIALFGILFKIFFGHKYPKISLASYLAMGWFVVFAGKEMIENLSEGGLLWLSIGGLSYTVGAVFYAWKKLLFNHAIWHLFVLAGAVSHFLSIYWYVIPTH